MRSSASLILASGSASRRDLLDRLGIDYHCHAPDIDETAHEGEAPEALVRRLAFSKAQAVAAQYSDHCIIGSDQVAIHDAEILGKPLSAERAEHNLRRFSGSRVRFLTSLTLLDTRHQREYHHTEPFEVVFRTLSDEEISRYVAHEQPLQSAGSFKIEGLGIALFERLEGQDPNALIGLPLIALCRLLREVGLDPLGPTPLGRTATPKT